MDKIILGEDQKNALDKIQTFLASDEVAFSLVGFAGTGKSLIVQYIVDILENRRTQYVLCAPTHKAKVVLERFTEREGVTLHKLLALSPNIEIINLDLRFLQFSSKNPSDLFPTKGVVICDESSMINDDLFELLLKRAKAHKSKIIFAGDVKQLSPVNSKGHSKVFELENSATLSTIYRQSSESGLNTVLPILREKAIPRFSNSIGTEGSMLCYGDVKSFFTAAVPYFKKAIKNEDILEAKFLSYTNNRVASLNKKMREALFAEEKEYNQFEFLTACENLEFNDVKFWNSMDYIIADKPVKININIPGFIKLPGYNLGLYDSANKRVDEINIISREVSQDYFNSLAYTIDNIRVEAIEAKKRRSSVSSRKWRQYYQMMGSFTTPIDLMYDNRIIRKKSFDYGYATTIHRSQGSSINNVFIDMQSISFCRNPLEIRQLQYVGLSRAKQNAYILQ